MIREIAKVPNAHEAAREHVLHEAPQKLRRGERHRTTLTVMGIVLPPKRHALAIEGEQAMITDRDAMGVASEVPQDSGGSTEGWFGIHDPVGAKERVDEGVPASRCAERGARAAQIQLVAHVRAAQSLDEFAAKDPAEHLHGQKKLAYFGRIQRS